MRKRRTDFSEANDDAEPSCSRSTWKTGERNVSNANENSNVDSLNRVKWTQEFMNKVRKSNAEYLNRKQKRINNDIVDIALQAEKKGDGVNTDVLNETDVEFLDYEDDLSIDEEDSEPNMEQELLEKSSGQGAVCDSAVTAPVLGLSTQREEELFNNPIIQNMMEKFFANKFKDMEAEKGNKGR